MQFALIISGIVFPILFVVGTVAAWRKSKEDSTPAPTTWRDDSLDDWRRERDANAHVDREIRVQNAPLHSGGETEEVSETKHQQRLGG